MKTNCNESVGIFLIRFSIISCRYDLTTHDQFIDELKEYRNEPTRKNKEGSEFLQQLDSPSGLLNSIIGKLMVVQSNKCIRIVMMLIGMKINKYRKGCFFIYRKKVSESDINDEQQFFSLFLLTSLSLRVHYDAVAFNRKIFA